MGAPYMYDISHLKVNNLTLILLTWRKWWAPNNWLVFTAAVESVYSAVRTDSLYKADYVSFLKG